MRNLIIFLLSFFSMALVQAQVKNEGIPFIKNYTQKEYNAASQNWAMVQDNRGMLYIGNNYGILEFDGNQWRTIPLSNKTIVRSLAIDKSGRIYAGGQGDFGYLFPDAHGQMSFISLKHLIPKKFQNFDDVWKIYNTPEGIVFCTISGFYTLKNNKISVNKFYSGPTGFAFYVHDKFFVQVSGQGIFEMKQGKMTLIPNSKDLATSTIINILPFADTQFLIVTEKDGLFTYDGYSTFIPLLTPATDFLKANNVNAAIPLAAGYAFGSRHNGLLITDKKGNPQQHLNREKGLQNSAVQIIYQDFTGNLWLGLNNGIDYVEINSPFTLFNAQVGIPGTAYTSLIDKDRLYMGTNDALYVKPWNNDKNPLNPNPIQLIQNTQGQVYNLQKIKGKILLAHHNGPYEIVEDQAVKLSDHQGAWLFLPLQNYPEYIICGTYNGLLLYKLVNNKLVFQSKIKGFRESSRIIEQDKEGNIWIAHGYKGVYKLRLSNDLSSIAKLDFYNAKHGFPSNIFINVFKIDDQLVFTGETGIYQYNKARNRFEEHETFAKIFPRDKHIRRLIQDKQGNIWFSVGDEMGILKKQGNGRYSTETQLFNKLQGQLVEAFEHIAYYDNANVFIGTDEGFVHYNPSFTGDKSSEQNFQTLIRSVQTTAVSRDSLLSGGAYASRNAMAVNQPELAIPKLPFILNSLRFTYSAIAFEDIDKVTYQYFLEGFDNNWSAWTPQIQKEYTNLREGDYTFHVRAKNIYNKESSEATFKFTIAPPWYRSWWAYIIYALLAMALLYYLKTLLSKQELKARERLKRNQEKALKLQEAQHMEEVLKAEKEIIKLNNEKLENELLHKNKELASSAMHVMHNLENIQSLREQLVEVIDQVKDRETLSHLRKLLKSVEEDIRFENNWEQFELHFNQIHQDFLKRLQEDFPQLTHRDIKLCAYLRLNLSSKEIASLLNLSLRGIETSRYRIRKKMNLDQDLNLTEFILKY